MLQLILMYCVKFLRKNIKDLENTFFSFIYDPWYTVTDKNTQVPLTLQNT